MKTVLELLGKILFSWSRREDLPPLVTVHQNERGFLALKVTDSVKFLIYVEDKDAVLMVKQPRAPMRTVSNPEGFIFELPAGRFDCDMDVRHLIAKEAAEEVGATIDIMAVHLVNAGFPLALSPGILTEKQYLAVVTIHSRQMESEDRVFGGKEEGEEIHRLLVPYELLASDTLKSLEYFQDMGTFALIHWFFNHLRKKRRQN